MLKNKIKNIFTYLLMTAMLISSGGITAFAQDGFSIEPIDIANDGVSLLISGTPGSTVNGVWADYSDDGRLSGCKVETVKFGGNTNVTAEFDGEYNNLKFMLLKDLKSIEPLTMPQNFTQKPLKLFYDEEAPYGNETMSEGTANSEDDGWERWSMPLGNGYVGANVFGRTETERIQLTEKTLANPYYHPNPSKTIVVGGLNNFSETYIDFGHTNSAVTNYERNLNLENAVSEVKYDYDGVTYTREYFVSYPDKAMVIKLGASENGKLGFTLRPTIPYKQENATEDGDGAYKHGTVVAAEDGTILLSGEMGYYNIDFEGRYKVIPTGGTMTYSNSTNDDGDADNGTITVTDADSAYIIIAIGTNYELKSDIFTEDDPKQKLATSSVTAHDKVTGYMSNAEKYTYDELKKRHTDDYKNIFGRVNVDLGAETPNVTTDVLVNNYKKGNFDKYLEELYFQYGRYLLIASSRAGSLPANLQGVWNRYNKAPWSAGYWHNINVQMNYWPAFNTNLAETFEAYVGYNKAYMKKAEKNATEIVEEYYPEKSGKDGGNGWVIGHGMQPYEAAGNRSFGHVGFTTEMFWDYYDFTRDSQILENDVYPVLSSAARFMTKAVEKDENVNWLSAYGDSPEQYVDGVWYHTKGTTYDQTLIYDNNRNTLKAAEALGKTSEDESVLKTIEEQIDKYDPIIVGLSGQVKEFREEEYYGDLGEYTHRHISQLVGLYPGNTINSTTPAWFDAAKVSLTERGDGATGWGLAHRMNLWARLKDGNHAYKIYNNLLKWRTATNLWDLHPPFQIDGNLGGTAGVAEMLLQSHEGYIEPLAALPDTWQTGNYSGLCARGNFEVSANWKNGNAASFAITSKSGEKCTLKYDNIAKANVVKKNGDSVSFVSDGADLIRFDTEKGETYIITKLPQKETVAPVTDVKASATGICDYNVSWKASTDAKSYNVYYAVESDAEYTLLGNTDKTLLDVKIAETAANKRMTFRVCAVNADGRESDGALFYANPISMEIVSTEAVVFGEDLQITVNAKGDLTKYKLYTKSTSGYDLIAESAYPVFNITYDSTKQYAVSAATDWFESAITDIDSANIGVVTGESSTQYYDNILRNVEFTGTSSTGINESSTDAAGNTQHYGYECLTDGSFEFHEGRFAAKKGSNSKVVVEGTLDSIYELRDLKIYDYVNSKETATRSDKTTVEICYDGTWTKVINEQPLDYNNEARTGNVCTTWNLNGEKASAIRITFQNSNSLYGISVYEIECSGTKSYTDRRELLKTVAETEDLMNKEYEPAIEYIVDKTFDEVIETLCRIPVSQNEIDSAAEKISEMRTLLESGNADVLLSETVYDGSTSKNIGSTTNDVKMEYNVAGNGGKASDDVVYKISGTPSSGGEGQNYISEFYSDGGQNVSAVTELNFMLGNKNSGLYIAFGGNGTTAANAGTSVRLSAANGMQFISNAECTCETPKSLEVGKWYKAALIIPYKDGGNDTVYFRLNGTEYPIKLSGAYDALRNIRVGLLKTNSYTEVYLDNIVTKTGNDAVYNPNRDKLNILESVVDTVTVNGQAVTAAGLTVSELKTAVGNDIRVYDETMSYLKNDGDTVSSGDTVVAFAKNLRNYERTYNYYTVN